MKISPINDERRCSERVKWASEMLAGYTECAVDQCAPVGNNDNKNSRSKFLKSAYSR